MTMEEKQKKFLFTFRVALVVWILIMNAIVHVSGFEYGWLIFISNIMLFTMEGEVKDRLISVELGGLVGLLLAVFLLIAVTKLTPAVGGTLGLLIPLAIILILLIICHPYAPKVLNNVGFAYLTCATIDIPAFSQNIGLFIGTFIVGSLIFNGVAILILLAVQKRIFGKE